jgi:hypothetical protein
MSEIEDNSAFPLHLHGDYGKGMTLRDYFAAAALTGLIQASAMPMFDDNGKNHGIPSDSAHDAIINGPGASDPQSNSTSSSLAWVAYGFADAMLAARKEGGQP